MKSNNTARLMGTIGRANLTRMQLILFSGNEIPSAIIQDAKYRLSSIITNYLYHLNTLRADLSTQGYKTLAYIDIASTVELSSTDTIIARLSQEPIVMVEAGQVGWFMLLGRTSGTVGSVGDAPLAMCGTVSMPEGGGDAVMGNTMLTMDTDARIVDIKLRI